MAAELLEEVGSHSSSVMLQQFAELAKKLNPSIATKLIQLCLDHPEVPPDQKEMLKNDLRDLEGGTETPAEF
jgi:hypothetical protein